MFCDKKENDHSFWISSTILGFQYLRTFVLVTFLELQTNCFPNLEQNFLEKDVLLKLDSLAHELVFKFFCCLNSLTGSIEFFFCPCPPICPFGL